MHLLAILVALVETNFFLQDGQDYPWQCIANPLGTSKYLCYFVTKNIYSFKVYPLSQQVSPCHAAPDPKPIAWRAFAGCDGLPYATLERITRPPASFRSDNVSESAPLPPAHPSPPGKSLRFHPKLQSRFGLFHKCYSDAILAPGDPAAGLAKGFCRFDYALPTVDPTGHVVGEYFLRDC